MHIILLVKQRTTLVKHVSSMCLDTSGEEGGMGHRRGGRDTRNAHAMCTQYECT